MIAIGFDKRRHKRRGFDAVTSITAYKDGKPIGFPIPCAIADISNGGARLLVLRPEQVPERGVLWLSATGSAHRRFRVVRRDSDHVRVQFL